MNAPGLPRSSTGWQDELRLIAVRTAATGWPKIKRDSLLTFFSSVSCLRDISKFIVLYRHRGLKEPRAATRCKRRLLSRQFRNPREQRQTSRVRVHARSSARVIFYLKRRVERSVANRATRLYTACRDSQVGATRW